MRRGLLAAATVAATLVAAAPAAGDGGPPQGAVQGWDGLARGSVRYVAVPTPGWTSLQVITRQGGRVLRFMNLKGSWGIPLVANDGSSDALLRDDRTLVLGDASVSRTLRKRSSFVFVDTSKLRVLRTIQLAGHFVFDAVSPGARYLYLTEYVSPQDFTAYRVRAFDLKRNRLLPKIVSDRRSWETTMNGWPVSRVNRDGWAFTLYATGRRPFIHALDTRHLAAVCIDLPWNRQPQRIYDYRLRFDAGGHLVVRGPRGRALVMVDRDSLRVVSSVPLS
jgi:hypothetical protein